MWRGWPSCYLQTTKTSQSRYCVAMIICKYSGRKVEWWFVSVPSHLWSLIRFTETENYNQTIQIHITNTACFRCGLSWATYTNTNTNTEPYIHDHHNKYKYMTDNSLMFCFVIQRPRFCFNIYFLLRHKLSRHHLSSLQVHLLRSVFKLFKLGINTNTNTEPNMVTK